MRFLARLLISAVVFFGVSHLSEGSLLRVASFADALYAALLLGLVNAFVKPVARLLTLPLRIVTLGLFSLVLNIGFFYGVAWLVPGVQTVGFLATVVAAFLVSFVTSLLTKVAGL